MKAWFPLELKNLAETIRNYKLLKWFWKIALLRFQVFGFNLIFMKPVYFGVFLPTGGTTSNMVGVCPTGGITSCMSGRNEMFVWM